MATKEALAEEKRRNVKQYIFALRKTRDSDIIEKLESQENKNGYLKRLVRADIEKSGSVELKKEGFTKREKKLITDYISDLIKKDIQEEEEEEEQEK